MSVEDKSSFDKNDELGVHPIAVELGEIPGKQTQRHLKPRHIQMIAISGAIGTGLFIGSGGALARAGPLSLVLGYAIYGVLVLSTFNAMGEMVSYLPIDGSYLRFAAQFVDPSYGFAMSWFTAYNNAVTVAAEATAVSSLINFWTEGVSNGVWSALFIASIFLINLFGVKYFGEGEFWFSIFKVLLILGLFFFTFITMLGGNPQGDRFGFRYWRDPGPMKEHITTGATGRFLGFWSTFIQAAFAYGGPDFLAMTSGEAKYPRRVFPGVFRRVIYRLIFFYVGGVLCVGILTSSNDPGLTSGGKGASASGFVLGAKRLGIPFLPDLINALILTSAWSAGCCQTFTASRNIYAAALNGHAPKFFLKTFRGIPIYALTVVTLVGCLCFLTLSSSALVVFTWITNLLGGLWILNLLLQNIIYVRFRAGVAAQGIDRSKFPFYRRHQLVYSWICIGSYAVIFLTNGFAVFTEGRWDITNFILAYITLPGFLVIYLGHKIYMKLRYNTRWGILKPDEIDLVSDKAEVDADELTYPPIGTTKKDKIEHWLWG